MKLEHRLDNDASDQQKLNFLKHVACAPQELSTQYYHSFASHTLWLIST